MRRHTVLFAAGVLAIAGTAAAQDSPYQVGDQVELKASGNHWQRCTVVDAGASERVMRMRCEPYAGQGYSRGGGIYTETITSNGVRKATTAEPAAEATPPPAAAGPAEGGGAGTYHVGQSVELEASGHWVPCTVSEIQGTPDNQLIRVRCPAYPALSRAAGNFIVHDPANGLRPATGQTGKAAAPVAARAPAQGGGGTLPLGEYACYGSGGRIMAGLGFKLLGGGRYTDLEGGNAGSYAIGGGTIRFTGGHLGGQTGRDVAGKSFRIGAQANCEKY